MNLGIVSRFLNLHNLRSFRTRAYNPAAATVFMHMPKASGMALTSGLIGAIAPRRAIAGGMDRVVFGDFQAFDSMDLEVKRRIYLDPASLPPDADFVSGHFSFSTLQQRYATAQYITVLREPVSRTLSHWLYWRTHSDDQLRPWGDWAELVKRSRGTLVDFLSRPELAFQIDNLYVRMLLWPNRLISNDDFIAESNDNILVNKAIARLKQFAYIDLVENPRLRANLQAWLGRPFTYNSVNETPSIPPALRTPLHSELKPEVFDLLEMRTRLDVKLWMALARDRASHLNPMSLRERTLMLNAARHSWLMTA
jgi:hypothetical protein